MWGIWFVFMIGVMMPFSIIRSVRRPPPAFERQRRAQASLGQISAFVFAIAHFRQGRKSMALIGLFALLFQWLVITTGSLVPGMVVHGLYDVIRGLLAGRRFEKLEPATQLTNVEA